MRKFLPFIPALPQMTEDPAHWLHEECNALPHHWQGLLQQQLQRAE